MLLLSVDVSVGVDGMLSIKAETSEEQAAAIASVAGAGTLTLDPNLQYQLRADNNGQGEIISIFIFCRDINP